jgi:8-oxo-dGTP diphosphatase
VPADAYFHVGQKAFIERDGSLLVMLADSNRLDFPGGGILEGETDLVESLMREVREETALEIEVGVPFTAWLSNQPGVYYVGYRCRYKAGEVILSEEHTGFRWVSPEDYREFEDGSLAFAELERFFATEGEA